MLLFREFSDLTIQATSLGEAGNTLVHTAKKLECDEIFNRCGDFVWDATEDEKIL